MNKRMAYILGTGLGSGYSPVAPGTAGSAVACLLFLPIHFLWQWAWGAVAVVLVAATYWVGVRAADVIEATESRKDPGKVVIDEVAGQWLTYVAVPLAFTELGGWIAWAAGFFLFRLFDIVKPWPARQMERIPGGRGVMLDDLFAGFYANIVLQVLVRFIL